MTIACFICTVLSAYLIGATYQTRKEISELEQILNLADHIGEHIKSMRWEILDLQMRVDKLEKQKDGL